MRLDGLAVIHELGESSGHKGSGEFEFTCKGFISQSIDRLLELLESGELDVLLCAWLGRLDVAMYLHGTPRARQREHCGV